MRKEVIIVLLIMMIKSQLSCQYFYDYCIDQHTLIIHSLHKSVVVLFADLIVHDSISEKILSPSWQKVKKSCIKRTEIRPIIKTIYDLQDAFDAWYYAVIHQKEYQHQSIVLQALNTYQKFSITDPQDALIVWICYATLITVQPHKKEEWQQQQQQLIEVIKKNSTIYGYLLIHIILYETAFGTKSSTNLCNEIFKELQELTKHYPYQKNYSDLLGEIIICYKLLQHNHDAWYKKTSIWLKKQKQVASFHTQIVLLLALS